MGSVQKLCTRCCSSSLSFSTEDQRTLEEYGERKRVSQCLHLCLSHSNIHLHLHWWSFLIFSCAWWLYVIILRARMFGVIQILDSKSPLLVIISPDLPVLFLFHLHASVSPATSQVCASILSLLWALWLGLRTKNLLVSSAILGLATNSCGNLWLNPHDNQL